MIEFLSLFLGLVSGPQDVRLQVSTPPVAQVELLVDGESRALLEAPPWTARVDFGPGLESRELVAVARDAEGREVGRARQAVNQPRPQAEVGVVLERDADGVPVAARLNWQSTAGRRPLQVRAELDGVELPAGATERIPLPETDPRRIHLLDVELVFGRDVRARRSISFGGAGSGFAETDLTALVARADKPGRDFARRDLAGWVVRGADRPEVVAIERGEVDLVFVKGDGAGEAILALDGASPTTGVGSAVLSGATGMIALDNAAPGAEATVGERLRRLLTLPDDWTIRLLLPHAQSVDDRYLAMQLFPLSPKIRPADGGLLWALAQDVLLPGSSPEPRIADAVAIAGLQAARGNHRRAIVVVLARSEADASRYSFAQVRRLLERLGVPLFVWRLPGVEPAEWEGTPIADFGDLRRAVRDLEEEIERQRIVWVAGSHARDELRLTETARRGGLESLY